MTQRIMTVRSFGTIAASPQGKPELVATGTGVASPSGIGGKSDRGGMANEKRGRRGVVEQGTVGRAAEVGGEADVADLGSESGRLGTLATHQRLEY